MLESGPVLLSSLSHLYRASDRVACAKKSLRGTGLTIRSERVTTVGVFGAFRDRRYRLVRED